MTDLSPLTIVSVLLGSALGGMARFAVSEWVARSLRETFPWGTLLVNVTGALTLGMLLGGVFSEPAAQYAGTYAFGVLGFLGSYTTVSSFALQSLFLVQQRRGGAAFGYAVLSMAGCLTAVAVGFRLGGLLG